MSLPKLVRLVLSRLCDEDHPPQQIEIATSADRYRALTGSDWWDCGREGRALEVCDLRVLEHIGDGLTTLRTCLGDDVEVVVRETAMEAREVSRGGFWERRSSVIGP